MVARRPAPKKKPTADLGWERGHTSGIEDRRPRWPVHPPGWQGPEVPQYDAYGVLHVGPRTTPDFPTPGKPRNPGPFAHAPGWRRGKGTLPKPPTKMPRKVPIDQIGIDRSFKTPQATTGKGITPLAAHKTPQATTGKGVKPLTKPKTKVKVKVHPRSVVGRSIAKNTGKTAGRRKS